jgi:hypothetical protein
MMKVRYVKVMEMGITKGKLGEEQETVRFSKHCAWSTKLLLGLAEGGHTWQNVPSTEI